MLIPRKGQKYKAIQRCSDTIEKDRKGHLILADGVEAINNPMTITKVLNYIVQAVDRQGWRRIFYLDNWRFEPF